MIDSFETNVASFIHCRHRPSEVELLFQLLRVFTIRHVPDFHFLRKFLDETVAKVGNVITPAKAQSYPNTVKCLHLGNIGIRKLKFQGFGVCVKSGAISKVFG